MTTPHDYVPAEPVEAAPLAGYCRPEIRREAFAAVLRASQGLQALWALPGPGAGGPSGPAGRAIAGLT